jgi:hypothetical protein
MPEVQARFEAPPPSWISRLLVTLMACRKSAPAAIVVASAAVFALPCIFVGIPGGGDAGGHVMYQYHFSQQLWAGDLYPRWLSEANKGYGSPMFFFQYPFPYYVTALLRPVFGFAPTALREGRELGVFCFLMLAGSGLSALMWFNRRCTPVASTIAALAYMSLPYLLGQVLYTRAALGELAIFPWMPLILALCDRVQKGRFEIFGAIAIAFALLVLSNVMYAVMFVSVIAAYAAAATRCNVSATFRVTLALVLGLCIAAIYIVPFLAYKNFLDLGAMARYHQLTELGRNFLYFTINDVQNVRIAILSLVWTGCLTLFVVWRIWHIQERNAIRFALLTVLGLGMFLFVPETGPALIQLSRLKVSGFESYGAYSLKMLITALLMLALGLLAYCRILGARADPREHVLVTVACGTFVLMLPWSGALWRALPATAVIQYPWRLCSILAVAVVGLFAIALDDCLRDRGHVQRKPSFAGLVLFAVAIAIGGNAIWRIDQDLRHPVTAQVDAARWVEFPFVTFVYPPAVTSFAAHVGASPYNYDVAPTPVQNGVDAQCADDRGTASVVRVTPRRLLVFAQCDENTLRIGQLYFPLWTAVLTAQSKVAPRLQSSPDGLIEVSLPSGRNNFELIFNGGFAETAGAVISAFSIAVVLIGFALTRLAAIRLPPARSAESTLNRGKL